MNHGETVVIPDIALDPRVPAEAYAPTFVHRFASAVADALARVGLDGAPWAPTFG